MITVVAAVSGDGYAEKNAEPIRAQGGATHKTYSESPALTQEDVDNHYQNYADASATYYFQEDRNNAAESVNCVGTVMDWDNEERVVIPNATLEFNGERIIVTDQNGRFQIPDLPAGEYDCTIRADGYKDAKYLNMRIDNVGSSVIGFFYLSAKSEIREDHNDFRNHSTDTVDDELEEQDNGTNAMMPAAMSSVPTIKKKVKVEMTDGTVRNMGRAEYLYGATYAEAVSLSDCRNKGMTDTQIWQYYCAMAEITNTLAVYFQNVEMGKHTNADICATTHCQSYGRGAYPAEITEAVDSIFYTNNDGSKLGLVLMHKPTVSTYNYICAFHFSSCGGNGTKTVSGIPYLKEKSCSDLIRGFGGHRQGLCQCGAAKMAKNGKRCEDILTYYFTNSDTEFCKMVS